MLKSQLLAHMQVDSSWEAVKVILQELWEAGVEEYIKAGQPHVKYLPQLMVDEGNASCWISVMDYKDSVGRGGGRGGGSECRRAGWVGGAGRMRREGSRGERDNLTPFAVPMLMPAFRCSACGQCIPNLVNYRFFMREAQIGVPVPI